jgi:hypothetical protein
MKKWLTVAKYDSNHAVVVFEKLDENRGGVVVIVTTSLSL